MVKWRLIDLEECDPYMAQTFYEAVALARARGLSENTILFAIPNRPYVCIGYHQVAEWVLDVVQFTSTQTKSSTKSWQSATESSSPTA